MDDADHLVRPTALMKIEVTKLSGFTPAVGYALAGALHFAI